MAANPGNLIPFTEARKKGRGAPSPILDNPEKLELFARAVADGQSIKDLAALFNVTERSVSTYKKDARVKAIAFKLIEDRVFRVTRKVDAEIERRLQDAEELDTDILLKIRKEFLGGALRLQTEGGKADANTINETMDVMEDNPEFAVELDRLLAGTSED
jgi:hypothetical protein